MSRVWGVILLVGIVISSKAQPLQDQFYTKWENQDTSQMLSFLQNWIKDEPYNPDVYVGFFNYYAIQTFQEVMQLDKIKPEDGTEYMELKDSLGNVEGYMHSSMIINDSILSIAMGWVDKGIRKFPDRLDLRMGKVYLSGETDHLEWVQMELLQTLKVGDSIQHQWKWMREENVENPQSFLYGSIQGHLYSLFERGDSSSYMIVEKVSSAMLSQNPDNGIAVSNLASCQMVKSDYHSAIELLKKAIKGNDKDPILYSNLGYCYFQLKEYKRAKTCYEKAIKLSEGEEKTYLEQKIQEIEDILKQ